MPVVVALFVRSLIQFAVTLGAIEFAERTLLPVLNTALAAVAKFFGVDQETSKDIIANEILIFAEELGIGVALLRTKIPTKIAELLGFTSRGFAKRPIKNSTAATASGTAAAAAKNQPPTGPASGALGETAARSRLLNVDTVQKWAQIVLGFFGVPVGLGIVLTNSIDFGAWPTSSYQGTFQRFFSAFGLKPDEDARAPRTASEEVFGKIYNALKLSGATTINDPYKGQVVPFTRDNLLDLVDRVAATLLVETGKATTAQIVAVVTPLTDLTDAKLNQVMAGQPGTGVAVPSAPAIRVFTGVVSTGLLGQPIDFVERQDDLITSVEELEQSARQNIGSFIAALGGRLSYDIRFVPSVVTKNGLQIRGQSQRIVSSYNKDGSPRFKTVVNKFAVADIFVFTERRTRTKIQRIVLGPADAVKLQPTGEVLGAIEGNLHANLVTNNIADISALATAAAPSAPAPAPAPVIPPPTTPPFNPALFQRLPQGTLPPLPAGDTRQRYIPDSFGTFLLFAPNGGPLGTVGSLPAGTGIRPGGGFVGEANATIPSASPSGAFAPPGQIVTTPPIQSKPARCGAQTLSEWYSLQNASLPSVSARSLVYQGLGLGQASLYAGTAEQNTKLLVALKLQAGC